MGFLRAIIFSKSGMGTEPRECQGSLASGIRVAAQTHQVSECREWLPVNGEGTWLHAPSSHWQVHWFDL